MLRAWQFKFRSRKLAENCNCHCVSELEFCHVLLNMCYKAPQCLFLVVQGRFEILSLSGSILLSENGGQRSRTGGLSVSLAGPDGRVLGGGVAGLLIAASPVQVFLFHLFLLFLVLIHRRPSTASESNLNYNLLYLSSGTFFFFFCSHKAEICVSTQETKLLLPEKEFVFGSINKNRKS